MISKFQKLVNRRASKKHELPVYFELIARSDEPHFSEFSRWNEETRQTEHVKELSEHHVKMGPGQYRGMKRLLAALEDLKKGGL